jgi:protoheme ferro-lyase
VCGIVRIGGDPYQDHIIECARLIAKEVSRQLTSSSTRPAGISAKVAAQLAGEGGSSSSSSTGTGAGGVRKIDYHLSYQSRVGPIKWLTPYTDDMLKYLGEEEKVSR